MSQKVSEMVRRGKKIAVYGRGGFTKNTKFRQTWKSHAFWIATQRVVRSKEKRCTVQNNWQTSKTILLLLVPQIEVHCMKI